MKSTAAARGSWPVLSSVTRNSTKQATELSARCLVEPLFSGVPESDGQPAVPVIAGVRGFRSTVSDRPRGHARSAARIAPRAQGVGPTVDPVHRIARARLAEAAPRSGYTRGCFQLQGTGPGRARRHGPVTVW